MVFTNKQIEDKALDQLKTMYNEHGVWYESACDWTAKHPEDTSGFVDQGYHFCGMCYALDIARELGYEPEYDKYDEQIIKSWTKMQKDS